MITVATCSNAAEAELLHSLLADAGWLCVGFQAGDDPADCWLRALHRQRDRVVSRGD